MQLQHPLVNYNSYYIMFCGSCHISTDRNKIWCVKAPKVDLDSYQISSGLVEKPLSYEAFSFYYKIVILLHFIVKKK